ncbi:MAG: 16S rRNA (cytidine(1402)-2'-O)-methyltransferase [Candidatus Acidiferrales bacterium]
MPRQAPPRSERDSERQQDESPLIAIPATGKGCLYLVATPIGNLEDITLRALRILKEVDLIACEDTRQTRKLLSHYEIHTRVESYHEHNEMTRAPKLVIELEQAAQIALVSDAGTPGISDPGYRLVALCLRHGIQVVPVPGPSALVSALAASGIATDEFVFIGFLPPQIGARHAAIESLAGEPRTLVFYEAPHRVVAMLEDALAILGDRHAVIAREVTKIHEEFRRGRISELLVSFQERPPRGEITVIFARVDDRSAVPSEGEASDLTVPLPRRIEDLMKLQNLGRKAALKMAARERGLSKREAYKQLLADRNNH